MEDVKVFLNQLDEANLKYELADAYYRGAPPEIFSNQKIEQALGIEDGQFKENFSAIPVEAMASRMRLNGFYVPGESGKKATEYLSQLWINSKMHTEINGCIRDWCKYGEGNIEIGITDEDEVDMCPVSVTISQMVYDPSDLRKKLFFGKLTTVPYDETQDVKLVTLKYSDRTERWIETYPDSNDYEPDFNYVDPETGIESWEYHDFGQVPAFHFRNETPFGSPEHLQAYGAQDQIVKIIMNEMGVIDYAGLPQRWRILEADTPEGTSNYGNPHELPQDYDEHTIDDGLANRGPGSMLVLPGGGSVGTFEAGSVEGFITAKEAALRSMAVLTNTPIRFFSDPGGQHPSGEALRAADARFKAKILSREEAYGFVLASAFAFALELAGFVVTEFPVVKWAPQAIDDSVDSLQIADMKVKLGIPKYHVLLELGYPEDLISSWGYSADDKPENVTDTTTTASQ